MKNFIALTLGALLIGGAVIAAQPEESTETTPSALIIPSTSQRALSNPPSVDDRERCHPSYSGCLDPDASDYDCAGGSGNGPKYTGPVRVLGYDEFDLDRDNDGWGCE